MPAKELRISLQRSYTEKTPIKRIATAQKNCGYGVGIALLANLATFALLLFRRFDQSIAVS